MFPSYYVFFTRHFLFLFVSMPARRKNYDNDDIFLDMLHLASAVANTKIR